MRLKKIFISNYKNLKDFSLEFEGDSFIDIFVGKNGSGKSNLFEALLLILQHIAEYDREKSQLRFDYQISFSVEDVEIVVEWKDQAFLINGKARKSIGKTPLPDNVLIYYSGHNETVSDLVVEYEDRFRKRIKSADFDESRRFIGIGPEYKELLLAVLLMQPEANRARQFIRLKLGVDSVGSEVRLLLGRPAYATDSRFDIQDRDGDRYWKPEGITKDFLDRLYTCVSRFEGSPVRDEGYLSSEDRYIDYFSIEKIQAEFSDLSAQELFRQFDNLKTLGMLAGISIELLLQGDVDATISHFSDGQFQSVYIYSIVELFKDRNCITLLDEPDSFLHPEWQFEFLKQVFDITDTASRNNHVLMSSHSAATLCNLEDQSISLFSVEGATISSSKRTKKEVIQELSDSFIQYSEDESKLLIDNVIRSSLRPILFVEGPSDVSILNTAHKKLYPDEDISVLIQDAFDRGFIKVLLRRPEIFTKYPNKHFFALFDFDAGYDDWRELGGDHTVTDVGLGLCRKLEQKNAHAFLLPIPANELRTQVWDDANPLEKVIPSRHFCIEHVFWGVEGLDTWFRTHEKSGQIRFKGDKIKFAQEVVPSIDAVCFESFRPMLEYIRAHCEDDKAAA